MRGRSNFSVSLGLLVLAFLACLSGCASGGLGLGEISDAPIALVYWDEADARKRADLMANLTGRPQDQNRLGVAHIDAVASLIGAGQEAPVSQQLARYPGRIVLLNARTLEKTRLEAAPPNARPLAWSEDRSRLLFNSDHLDGGIGQIYEYDFGTQEVRKLTHGPAYHLEGDYGLRGEVLVNWVSLREAQGKAGMDIRSESGAQLINLMEGQFPVAPGWSPTEDLIVYGQADESGGARDQSLILVREAKPGGDAQPLGRGRDAVFTPDGRWIVFSSQGPRGWRLQRMRPDGSARKALGQSVLSARSPAISPDGKHVAYVSNEGGFDRLYVRRMDGSGDRILLGEGSVAFPAW
ncbi:MAG: hypothetical protein P8Q97_07410 [Myxococcota bacterium]|nr:hypothetical protein [Myxococcota bacterium]